MLTKEVFVLRVRKNDRVWDPFYLLWALSLRAVRDQWRRIALMQTNREDCGDRYREIILPKPPSRKWAKQSSDAFATYFKTIASARDAFIGSVSKGGHDYVATCGLLRSSIRPAKAETTRRLTVTAPIRWRTAFSAPAPALSACPGGCDRHRVVAVRGVSSAPDRADLTDHTPGRP